MGFLIERFDHIVVNCRDVDAMARWYADVLGMRIEKFGHTGRTALRFGDQKINLRPLAAPDHDPQWETGAVEAAGSQDLCLITDSSPDEVREHLDACGVAIIRGPVIRTGALGPINSQYCRDPEGNLIEIAVYV
ncbi:VOC family protein [Lolliginicoccus suaedae]|uniref:VOC family protein n=1 Tax=Lolliginicoccus suaedae TaxID=2605429 RepID=UPI0011ED0077|nr:VOC family protein [Lolliginicoccus suaedae]